MPEKNTFVHFSYKEFTVIFGSFREVCFSFAIPPDFDQKFGLPPDSAERFMESLWPAARLMSAIFVAGEPLPTEHKVLQDGYSAYWDKDAKAVLLRDSDGNCLVYQPENGREYYDALAEMPFTLDAAVPLSILIRPGLFELKVMLAMVRETYRELFENRSEGRFHARLGAWPEEAVNAMKKLQKEIDERSAR